MGRHLPQKDMTLEVFESALDAIDGLEHIELQGEGEPLLNPHIFQMVKMARDRFPKLKISIITNGSCFQASNVEQIIDLGIYKLYVSIESADPEMFKSIRGGSLARVERGIRLLQAEKSKQGGGPAIGFAITVLKETSDMLHGITQFYLSLGLDGGIMIQPLQSMEVYRRFYDDRMMAQMLSADDWQRFSKLRAANRDFDLLQQQKSPRRAFYADLYNEGLAAGCPWLQKGLYVEQSGRATPCCFVKEPQKTGFGQLSKSNLGNILQRRSVMQQQLRSGVIPQTCRGCATAARVTRR